MRHAIHVMSVCLQEVMNSALSSHTESIPKFIHSPSSGRPYVHQPLSRNPRHTPLLLRFLRRRLCFFVPHIFGEELYELDHHRVITLKDFFHKGVIVQVLTAITIAQRKNRPACILERSSTASFQKHHITPGFGRKKYGGINSIERLSK